MVPYTNPMSASYGAQGEFGAQLPVVNPFSGGAPLSSIIQDPNVNLFNTWGGATPRLPYTPGPVNILGHQTTAPIPFVNKALNNKALNAAPATVPSTAPSISLNTGSFNPQQVLTSIADRLASGAVEPLNFADADALGLTEMLDDPNSGYVKDTATNQYVPSNLGPTQATKNTAAAQRRADMAAQGLVYNKHYGWIPFKQWQRLRKQKGAKIAIAQAEASAAQTETQDGFVGSFGVVSFNTDAGQCQSLLNNSRRSRRNIYRNKKGLILPRQKPPTHRSIRCAMPPN
jgi:hypothetical protein